MTTRFDYVKYDERGLAQQTTAKTYFVGLENWLATALKDGRAKALVMTKLEEAYMWVGKAIRDEQVEDRTAELQEGRVNQ